MQLKEYQTDALAILQRFYEDATVSGPKRAYESLTGKPDLKERLRGYAGDYTALEGLEDVPYVCLRLPTGGGKTILAAHAINVVRKSWMGKEHPLVLWLVPTNTIREQTVAALKNPRHPYRKALDEQFGGAVRIFNITEFTQILPQDIETKCCIVVGTIQTLKVEDTNGRKVYAHHEMLEPHFTRLNGGEWPDLEPVSETDPTPRFSFANLLHIHRPLMIVDEAHTAVTTLAGRTQVRINPSAILEFTATPRTRSNNLYNVSAQELKDAQMIKLPVRLTEHREWESAVLGAVQRRAELVEMASKDKDYIRPIVLFQAQNANQPVNVEILKSHLIDVLNVPAEEIAVATGDVRDLDGMDLLSPNSKINYVITVQALKEGWDCPFAYVFCSVANVSSASDVEQLLGRVLRMPYARKRTQSGLNKAYANVTSESFANAANSLKDGLVKLGFTDEEARSQIEVQPELDPDGLFGPQGRPSPRMGVSLADVLDDDTHRSIAEIAPNIVSITRTPSGETTIELTGVPTIEQVEAIEAALPATSAKGFGEQAKAFVQTNSDKASPAARGASFTAPAIIAPFQGELELVEPDRYPDEAEIDLANLPAMLSPGEFMLRTVGDEFELDVDGQRVTQVYISSGTQSTLLGQDVESLSVERLAAWFAKDLQDPMISFGQLQVWLTELIANLHEKRSIPISALAHCRYILLRSIREKISGFKAEQIAGVYERSLFGPEAKCELSVEQGFKFHHGMFADVPKYKGAYLFQKHFLGPLEVPVFDGAPDGEEFQCAQAIDSLPMVKHWVRNVARHQNAFRLPLLKNNFYPDFLAELEDGRIAVIEYKGAAYASNDDSRSKIRVGNLWEALSKGRGAFIFVERTRDGLNMRDQLLAKFAQPES